MWRYRVLLVYLDVLLLLNFGIDLALLFAVAAVTGRRAARTRLVLAAAIGALYGVAAVLPAGPALIRGPLAAAVAAGVMLATAFWPVGWRHGLTMVLWFYGLGTAAGGLAALAGTLVGPPPPLAALWPTAVPPWWGAPAGALLVLLLGGGAWRSAHRLQLTSRHQAVIGVELADQRVDLPARIDTGHDAVDPLNGSPVTIVEADAFPFLVPNGAAHASFESVWGHLSSGPWAARARLFPYRSLGAEHGLLAAVRVDCLHIENGGRRSVHPGAVVALYPGRLDGRGSYRALVPAALVVAALGAAAQSGQSRKGL